MKKQDNTFSRREFMSTVVAAGTFAAAGTLMMACGSKESAHLNLPPLLDRAPDGPLLKAGLVGCGGRGTGAALNYLDAGSNLQIAALADVFEDRLQTCRNKLKEEKNVEIPDENCFIGFDAYQKLIDSGIDIVLLATPPHFRPEHLAACVNARKHAFIEKPVAVDPVGVRSIMGSAKKAKALGLCIISGTQQRHSRDFIDTLKKVKDGAIGDIVSANCYYNTNQLWYRTRQEGWSDMEYMIRDWVNWCWLSGDHIVEQFIHKLDMINWFMGSPPIKAVGFGARHRRPTGDQYDFFSVDYVYENGINVQGMCRQIDGCTRNVSHFVRGTRGYSNCQNKIWNSAGKLIWEYPYPKDDSGEPTNKLKIPPKVQEHIDLVTAIRTNKPRVEAEDTAISTMIAVMGRISAYSGKEVTWEEMMNSDLRLGPTEYKMGPIDIKPIVPVPGIDKEEKIIS